MPITKDELQKQPGVFDRDKMGDLTKGDFAADSKLVNGVVTKRSSIISRSTQTVTSSSISRSSQDVTVTVIAA